MVLLFVVVSVFRVGLGQYCVKCTKGVGGKRNRIPVSIQYYEKVQSTYKKKENKNNSS